MNGVDAVKTVKVVQDFALGAVLQESTAVGTVWKRNLVMSMSLAVGIVCMSSYR